MGHRYTAPSWSLIKALYFVKTTSKLELRQFPFSTKIEVMWIIWNYERCNTKAAYCKKREDLKSPQRNFTNGIPQCLLKNSFQRKIYFSNFELEHEWKEDKISFRLSSSLLYFVRPRRGIIRRYIRHYDPEKFQAKLAFPSLKAKAYSMLTIALQILFPL